MSRYVTISTFSTPHQTYDGAGLAQAVDKTIAHWDAELDKVAPDTPDLILLPENCDTYLGMELEQMYEYHDIKGDRITTFFQERAKAARCYICYPGWRIMPDGSRRNAVQVIDRQGEIAGIYHKNVPVIGEIEQCNIRSGAAPVRIETDFGSLCNIVCFDLNFDFLRQQIAELAPDLVLFSSVYHGGLMQAYWAYSCRAHFVASVANLPSPIISPDGRTLATTTNYFHYVTQRVNLDCRLVHLDGNWEKLNAMKAKYGPRATFTDPGHLASVLVASESDNVMIDDLIAEFDIELLDDYLQRSASFCRSPANVEACP